MSVLIKGLKMPKDCAIKVAIRGDDGIASVYLDDGKADYYSVIELPDHGDLVDRDELYRKTAEWEEQARNQVNEGWTKWNIILTERTAFKYDVADAPVVIPAERSEDEADKRRTGNLQEVSQT